tara:strand:+ start:2840 stop:3607 length:768 start_codon:yes stop_codon:yes gene_type:complete
MFLVACQENVTLADQEVEETDSVSFAVGDAFSMSFDIEKTADRIVKEEVEITDIIETDPETSAAPLDYPPGPYSIEKFKVLPNMTFYNPWDQQWISLSDMYNHDKHKAFILVSSAGWCGPCLSEAAALINIYEKYNVDGLEIIYTLGNTNIPGEVPFDDSRDKSNSGDFHADLKFMENWQLMTQDLANKKLNYKMYADPNREIAKYLPQHAWPLSVLVTTKDMGIRLVEEGYWNALMENKINLVLFNEVPTIPFD